ncbi:MAG TPA: DUF2807 domain-containing protein [Caulobacteraceae bacterium]
MRGLTLIGLTAALATASTATAAPAVDIRHAVARVIIIPEARADIVATVVRTNSRLPLRIYRSGDDVIVDGGLGLRAQGCHSVFGKPAVGIWGLGSVGYDDMPQLVIRTPMDVRVSAGEAVFGSVGRSASLELDNSGCGDWTLANVAGPMRLRLSGSGDAHAGSAGSADLRISGSGDITTRDIRGGLETSTSGSGDIDAASINGPFHVHVAGSGDVRAHRGQASDMQVSISGSGDVSFGGVAQSLDASVAGSGDVSVARVTGLVAKHLAGSGDVRIGD